MTTRREKTDSMLFSRRTVLRAMGVQLALPVLSTLVPRAARAQTAARERFVGVFFPNGAHMPGATDGNWNFDEALAPMVAAGHRDNTMIVRGLFNGFNGVDPHWQNTAAFLSCEPIVLGDAAVARCGQSLDQLHASRRPTPLRSLEIGAPYYHVHPLNDHPGYSNDYLNRISWQSADSFRSPIGDPRQMFDKIFGATAGDAAQIRHLHSKKQSVLDFLHKDATRLSNRLPGEYRPVLQTYMDTVREVETQLDNTDVGCGEPPAAPTGNFSDFQANYRERYQLMNTMVALAMQCGSVNSATFMYGPSSSDLHCAEVLGAGTGHHGCAHNGGNGGLVSRLRGMNNVHMTLLADLVTKLKQANVFDNTLLMAGSDMSDGDLHLTDNIPVVVCGAGSDLRFGQAVGSRDQRRPMSDLHLELIRLLGFDDITAWGSGQMASTGQSLPIRV